EQPAVAVEIRDRRRVGLLHRRHMRFRREPVGLAQVAGRAGGDHVLPRRRAALAARRDVVEGQLFVLAAVLAGEAVAQEHVEAGEGWLARRPDIGLERYDRRQPHLEGGAFDHPVVVRDDVDAVEKHRLDRVLPAPKRQRIVAQGAKIGVKDQRRTVLRRDMLSAKGNRHARAFPSRRTRPSRGPNPSQLLTLIVYSPDDAFVKPPAAEGLFLHCSCRAYESRLGSFRCSNFARAEQKSWSSALQPSLSRASRPGPLTCRCRFPAAPWSSMSSAWPTRRSPNRASACARRSSPPASHSPPSGSRSISRRPTCPRRGATTTCPIALGVMAAIGALPSDALDGHVVLGELALDGTLTPVAGVLPA